MKLDATSEQNATAFVTSCLDVKASDIVTPLSAGIQKLGTITGKQKSLWAMDKATVDGLADLKAGVDKALDGSKTDGLSVEARQSLVTYLATAHLALLRYPANPTVAE